MKRQVGKIILFSVLTILFFACEGFAQSKLHYELNGGFVYSGRNGNLLSNWGKGWTLGAGMSYGLTPVIKIAAKASYQKYLYTGGYLLIPVPAIEGFRRKINGEATNIYELSMGARFVNQRNFVKFYLTIGGGLLFTDIGEIIIEEWLEDNPGKRYFSVHPGTGTLVKEGSASFGFGFIALINSKLRLIFEFKFIGTFKTNADLIPFTLAIQF